MALDEMLLEDNVEWQVANPQLKNDFRDAMKNLHYGYGAVQQAWHFFRSGWLAGMRNAGYT